MNKIVGLVIMGIGWFVTSSYAGDVVVNLQNGQRVSYPTEQVNKITFEGDVSQKTPERTAQELRIYRFSEPDDVLQWSTEWKWEKGNRKKGSATWSNEFGGTAHLAVSGAPCVIDFWTELSEDLQYGDEIVVRFHTKKPTEPISGFDLTIGPARPNGHKQKVSISVNKSGSFISSLPIWSSPFKRGTPFGVHFAVWPGQSAIYIESIAIMRKS